MRPSVRLGAAVALMQVCPCRSMKSLAIRRCIQYVFANSMVRPVPCLLAVARPILACASTLAPTCTTIAAIAATATTTDAATAAAATTTIAAIAVTATTTDAATAATATTTYY